MIKIIIIIIIIIKIIIKTEPNKQNRVILSSTSLEPVSLSNTIYFRGYKYLQTILKHESMEHFLEEAHKNIL